MARRTALALLLAAGCAATGCSSHHAPPAQACTKGPDDVTAALRRAPGGVALSGGTSLADCVGAARQASDLENIGAVFTAAAARLAARAARDPTAALELGFLVGATERGATRTAGLQAELVNRMRSYLDGAHLSGAARAAAARGRAAGRRDG
jgi:hypothetical protein